MSTGPLSRDTVKHVARLARLAIEDAELDRMTSELGNVLTYMEQLNELDTTQVEPFAMELLPRMALRSDVPTPLSQRVTHEEALSQTARPLGDGFGVPAFVDE